MKVKIVLRGDKMNTHGLYPVVIQISNGKDLSRIPLGFSLKSEDFDAVAQTVLKQNSEHKSYNQKIELAKSQIERVSKEVLDLVNTEFIEGLPVTKYFRDLYLSNEKTFDRVIKNYTEKYNQLVYEKYNQLAYEKLSGHGREITYPIKFNMPASKYGDAMVLLKKLLKNQPDPKIDELLALKDSEEIDEKEKFFLEVWDKYYKHCLREKAANTSIRIPNNLNILKSFATANLVPLTFELFNKDFGSELKHYLLTQHINYRTKKNGITNGTIHNITKSISAFLNWAISEEYFLNLAFKKWEKKKPKSDLQYLTESQLKELWKFELPKGGSLDKTKDLWLFSAFSAMRWGDIERWVPSNVTIDGLIEYRSEKEKKDCRVGLNEVTTAILEKYDGLLPIQNDSLVNKNIKIILGQMGYDKNIINRVIGMGTKEIVTPEYAHIIGVPFKMFKGGKTEPPPQPIDLTHIAAIPERQEEMEIEFPNVVGYRVENYDGEIKYDFSGIENYEIDGSKFPTETIMTSPISTSEEKLQVKSVLEKRDNELFYLITKELIKRHFSDEENNPRFQINPIIHTKFLHFLWEKYNDTIDPEDEDNIPIPLPEDDEDQTKSKKNKKLNPEIQDEDEDEEDIEEPQSDEEILEKLISEYRQLKKQYENKLHRRKRR